MARKQTLQLFIKKSNTDSYGNIQYKYQPLGIIYAQLIKNSAREVEINGMTTTKPTLTWTTRKTSKLLPEYVIQYNDEYYEIIDIYDYNGDGSIEEIKTNFVIQKTGEK